MALRLTPVAFGALYGYLPPEKRSTADILKFVGITSPIYAVGLIADHVEKQTLTPKTLGGALLGAPLAIGFVMCIGGQLGKMARKVKEDA